ncbi:hypothetical protein [Nonomuraea glycinis]|uniref:hypothetical protein n=1 Tax=Nonomuraea glycinis TaxID=2047744 RepID=UPI0033A43401
MTSDDIWRQFGVASWRAYRARLRAVISGCVTLMVIAASLWWSGAVAPHIRWEIIGFFLHADVDENGVLSTSMYIDVENEGLVPFTLTDISMEIPGFRLLPAEARDDAASVTVRSGDMGTLRRTLVITDCAAVPHEPQPIRFTYTTWLDSGTAEVTWGSWWLEGSGERIPIAWQRGLATQVCNGAVSSEW